jgi:predicted DNA-binding transcriptional regulator AlpA
MTVRETARALGCAEWTLYETVRRGTCPVEPVRLGRKLVFPIASVERLLHLEQGALSGVEGVSPSTGEVGR